MSELHQIGIAVIFHLIDLASGLIAAIRRKELQSAKMRDGLFKKIGFIFCYLLAFIIDTQGAYIGFQLGTAILPVFVIYAITTELVSIIENVSKINPDLIPEKLQEMFHVKHEV